MTGRRRVWRGLAALGIAAGLAVVMGVGAARAAEDFPRKEVTVIVNYGPGGGRDILARGVGKTMGKYLGVPVVVVNRPGGGGSLGLSALYGAAPDGYTIGVGGSTELMDQILDKRDFDSRKFEYIGRIQSSPLFWFVKRDSPLRSVQDLKTAGKPIRHATFALTATQTVAAMILASRENFPLVVVGGYQGSAATLLAAVRGEVELGGSPESAAVPFVESGQLRPLVTIGPSRAPSFKDVPTVVELGYPELANLGIDFWFMAPPGTPRARVRVLEEALMKTLKDPEFQAWAKTARVDVAPLGSAQTAKLVTDLMGLFERYRADIEKYIKK